MLLALYIIQILSYIIFFIELPPVIEISESTYYSNFVEALKNGPHYDVMFVSSNHPVYAHRVILQSAPFWSHLKQENQVRINIPCNTTSSLIV